MCHHRLPALVAFVGVRAEHGMDGLLGKDKDLVT
jgi:hypothetical protein